MTRCVPLGQRSFLPGEPRLFEASLALDLNPDGRQSGRSLVSTIRRNALSMCCT